MDSSPCFFLGGWMGMDFGGEEIYTKKQGVAMNVSLKHHEKRWIAMNIILIFTPTITPIRIL